MLVPSSWLMMSTTTSPATLVTLTDAVVLEPVAVATGPVGVVWLTGIRWLDGLLTVGVAIYVGTSALSLIRDAGRVLMDAELPPGEQERILSALRVFVQGGEIEAWHGLRTRSAGQRAFVEVHLEMDRTLLLERAHEIGDRVEAEIRRVLPHAHVIVHLDVERDQPD